MRLTCAAWLLALGGCLPDATPPRDPPPPPACGDGTCDLRLEDCQSCPRDCPCCTIVDSVGVVLPLLDASGRPVDEGGTEQDPTRVIGAPDGQFVVLDERSELTLNFGREVFDAFDPTNPQAHMLRADFAIHGRVTSTSAIQSVSSCSGTSTQDDGVFEVMASPDGIVWSTIGVWARTSEGTQVDEFDIGCAGLKEAKWVRIKASPQASAELDAITALNEQGATACLEQLPP